MVFNNVLLHSRSFAEKQIKEQELQLTKSLMNCVSEAIILIELNGSILYFNNAASCLFGYSCEELLTHIDLSTKAEGKLRSTSCYNDKEQAFKTFTEADLLLLPLTQQIQFEENKQIIHWH
jgi:PAS domain-containing protein